MCHSGRVVDVCGTPCALKSKLFQDAESLCNGFGGVFSAAETGVRSLRPSDVMTVCKHTYRWGRVRENTLGVMRDDMRGGL